MSKGTARTSFLNREHGEYDHTNKVVEWGFDENHEWTGVLYGCSLCDIEPQPERFPDRPQQEYDHSNCDVTPCFGCKARGLLVNTGDAGRSGGMTKKEWDKELDFYKQARAQGIQPEGTSRKAVENALDASEKLGKAYDGGTMPASKHITKPVVEVLKELGK